MSIKYCLPIIKKTKDEVENIINNNPDYDFYEIWLDYIEDLDNPFIESLLNNMDGNNFFIKKYKIFS